MSTPQILEFPWIQRSAIIAKRNEATWTSPNSSSPKIEALRRNFLAKSALESVSRILRRGPQGQGIVRDMLLAIGYEVVYVKAANVLIFKSGGPENFMLEMRLSDDVV